MRMIKRLLVICLSCIMLASSVTADYAKVSAAEIPVVYTAWEVWQMILLSLGVTVEVQSSDLVDETCTELKDTFDLWVDSNGFDDITADSVKGAVNQILEDGKKGIVNISENVWGALKGWMHELYRSDSIPESIDLDYIKGLVDMDKVTAEPKEVEEFWHYVQTTIDGSATFLIIDCPAEGTYKCIKTYEESAEFWARMDEAYVFRYGENKWAYFNNHGDLQYAGYFSQTFRPGSPVSYYPSDVVLFSSVSNYYEKAPDVYFPDLEGLQHDICKLDWDIQKLLESGAYDVITSGRTWDGTNVAGDVILTFPQDIPWSDVITGIRTGDISYTDVLDKVGAIPVDKTKGRDLVNDLSIAEAVDKVKEKEEAGDGDHKGDSETVIREAVNNIDSNKKNHILQDKHNWNKLVPDSNDPNNWGKIAGIITTVLSNGTEEKYKGIEGVFIKTYQIGEETVQVTYKVIDGILKISDAWVQ